MMTNPISFDDAKKPEQGAAPAKGVSFDDAMRPEGETAPRGITGWARDAAAWGVKGAIGVPEAAVGLADIVSGGRVGKALENEGGAVGFRPKQAREAVNDWHSDATKEAQRKFQDADGIGGKFQAAIQNPSNVAGAVIESLPAMGGGAVAARGLMAATKLGQIGLKGATAAGAAGEGAMMAGSQAEAIRQETKDGLLTPGQAGISLATGVAGGLVGGLSGRFANKLGIGDADTMLAQGAKGVAKQNADEAVMAAVNPLAAPAAKSIPRQAIEGAITEGLLEELPQSVAEQLLQNLALDKPWSEGLDEAIVLGTLSGGAMGAGAAGFRGITRPGDLAPSAAPSAQPAQPGATQQQGWNTELGAAGQAAEQPASVLAGDGIPNENTRIVPELDTQPGVAQAALPGGIDMRGQAREFDTGSLDPQPPAPVKPSEAMGLDPAAGPMSAAAVLAVDSGASEQMAQATQAQADAQADFAKGGSKVKKAEKGMLQPAAPAVDESGAAQPLTSSQSQTITEETPALSPAEKAGVASTLAGSELSLAPLDGAKAQELQAKLEDVKRRAADNGSWNVPLMGQRYRIEDAMAKLQASNQATATTTQAQAAIKSIAPSNASAPQIDTQGATNGPQANQAQPQQTRQPEAPAGAVAGATQQVKPTSSSISATDAAELDAKTDEVMAVITLMGGGPSRETTRREIAAKGFDVADKTIQSLKKEIAKRDALQAKLVTKQAVAGAAGGVAPDTLVKTNTLGMGNIHVKQADLDSERVQLPIYSADGQRKGGSIHRENLDPTGEKKAADNEVNADNPLFNVITRKDGTAFPSKPAANRELNKQALGTSHEVVPAEELKPGASGYVLRKRNLVKNSKYPPTDIRGGDVLHFEGKDYTVNSPIEGGVSAERIIPGPSGVSETETRFFYGDEAIGAKIEADKRKARDTAKPKDPPAPDPIQHAGFKIYPVKVKVGNEIKDKWAVQTLPNAEREKKGERQLGGDPMADTLEAAKDLVDGEIESEKRMEVYRAEMAVLDERRKEADAIEQARKDANKNKSIGERRIDAFLDKPTSLHPNAGLGTGTRREAMQKAIEQERLVSSVMVPDTAAKNRDQNYIDSRRNLPTGNINYPGVKEYLEAIARKKADNYEKPDYRVYMGSDNRGSYYEISKTEYDYAQSLKVDAKHDEKPVSPGVERATPAPAKKQSVAVKAAAQQRDADQGGALFSRESDVLRMPTKEEIRWAEMVLNAANPKKATVESVRAAVRQLVNGIGALPNGLGRIVVANTEEIRTDWVPLIGPVDIKSESKGAAQGFYSPQSRTVFLIADHIRAGDELGVVVHELMHKHGPAVLGKAGWDKLHGTITGWKDAEATSMERQVYDDAARRVEDSGAHLSNQELFPYAVQVALEMGVRPNAMAQEGTVARWLAGVRQALRQAWDKITNKPDQFKAQDMVNLAFGIAQMENPAHAAEIATALTPGHEELQALAVLARGIGNENQTVKVGKVSERAAKLLAAEGHPVTTEYDHTVDMFAVRHMFKEHSDTAAEKARGNLPLADKDIAAIPDIVQWPNKVILGQRNKIGRDLVGYLKRLPDGTTLYFEEVRTGSKSLAALSMRKYPATTSDNSIIEALRHIRSKPASRGDLIVVEMGEKVEGGHGTNEAVTNPKDVVGNSQDRRSADDTSPGSSTDYRASHRPPEIGNGGARLDDLTKVYPEDIYSANGVNFYGGGEEAMDRATMRILQSIRGKPDQELRIYRAVPKSSGDDITSGDWVSINKDYASDHGELALGDDFKVIEKTVKVRDLITNADSFQEAGYFPNESTAPDGDGASFAGGTKASQGTTADRAVMDMVREGRTAQDILRLVAGTSKSRFNKQVARLLLKTGASPVVSMGSDMGGGDGFKFLAKYSRANDALTLTEGAQTQAEHIFMHEMVHAATLKALDRKGLASLQMRRLYEHVKKQGGANSQYGMKNVGEFVAEAFTNPEFQRALKGMSAPSGGTLNNAWDGFVRILRSILGLPQDATNALSQALELGVAVMREDMALRKRGARGRVADANAAVDQTRTPEFKAWYGDWQNAGRGNADGTRGYDAPGRVEDVDAVQRRGGLGKINRTPVTVGEVRFTGASGPVGKNGGPVRFFHGTKEDITTFELNHPGRHDRGWLGRGIYATSSADLAELYAEQKRGSGGDTVMSVFMAVRNPYVTSNETKKRLKNASQAAIDAFTADLKAKGHDGVAMAFSDGHIELMAFEPTQVKSAIGNNGNFDPEDGDIAHFGTAAAGATSPAASKSTWDAPLPTGFDDVVYKMQDKLIDTKRVVEAITKFAGKIKDDLNVYLQEELFHGRAAKRVSDFGSMELKPVLNQMRLLGLSLEDMEEFLHARHAKEANALIAGREEGMPDGGSGMLDSEADAYLAKLPTAQRQKLEAVAKKIDAIIASTRQLYVDYGLENKETVDGWGDMFQAYVPLMREGKDGGMGIGQGFTVKGKEVKGRTGSKRKVVDILANIAAQREKVIVRGEKNRVAVGLIGLAAANPNAEFWTVRSQPPTERVYDEKSKKVIDRPDSMFKQRDNVVTAKVKDDKGNVTEQAVVFNEDNARAMRMASALKNLDAGELEGLLGVSAKITRYFSAINTQYNPVFGVVNVVRDVQGAMVNLGSTPLAHQRVKIGKNTVSALAGIYQDVRAVRDGKPPTSKWGKLWQQMQEDGGTTGYRELFATSADRANELKSIINPDAWADSKWGSVFTAGGTLKVPVGIAKQKAGALFDWLSDYNEAMENGVRLAAYSAALDEGMTREQAASLSKNLTVNFNRKGQVGQQAGAVYAFFNAAMQGTARIGEVLFDMDGGNIKTLRLSKTGKNVVVGGLTLGAMQALILAGAGFEDEDPPEFLRERSLIIPTGGKSYVSIPMPLGLHVIPGIGRHATEFALSGFKDPAKRALSIFGMAADAFNPIGNAGLSMQTLAPTALDPLVALTENRDWTGKPIARTSSNKAIPGHSQWKDTATTPAKWIAEAINWISGGDEYVAGVLSPTPDQIDYLFAQVTGGVGRELSKVEQAARSVVSGEELPTYKMPLVGRFYGNSSGQASEGSAFYANVDKLNAIETKVKAMRKDGKFAEAAEYIRSKPEAVMIFQANAAERQIQKLKRDKRELIGEDAPREAVRAKEEQITAVMARLNRAAEARKERAGI